MSHTTTAPPAYRARHNPHYTLAEKLVYAEELRRSSLLRYPFAGSKANVLYGLEYAEATGLHPLTVMEGLFRVRGKVCANAHIIASLVRMAGHRLRTTYDKTTRTATTTITRADDPEPHTVDWTLDHALQAKLIEDYDADTGEVTARNAEGQPTAWQLYTRDVQKARSLTACAREACQEALYGVIYTPEELGADVDADGNLLEPPIDTPASASERERRQLDPQDGAVLAHGSTDPAFVRQMMQALRGANLLDSRITAPDTGCEERLHTFLLRTGMSKTRDTDNAMSIFRAAEAALLLDELIPSPGNKARETLGNYLRRAGRAIKHAQEPPEPDAVTVVRRAAEQAASASSTDDDGHHDDTGAGAGQDDDAPDTEKTGNTGDAEHHDGTDDDQPETGEPTEPQPDHSDGEDHGDGDAPPGDETLTDD